MSEQITSDFEVDEINYDSFVNLEQKGQEETGYAILKDVSIKTLNQVPTKTRNHIYRNTKETDEVFVFEGSMTGRDEEIYIYLQAEDMTSRVWDVVEEWTGSRNISDLAGSILPVKHLKSNHYVVESFHRFGINIPVSQVRELCKSNIIEYKNGSWNYENYVSEYHSTLSDIAFYEIAALLLTANFTMLFDLPQMLAYGGIIFLVISLLLTVYLYLSKRINTKVGYIITGRKEKE